MNTFVTVLTVQYPQQLWIIKGRLESEGIQCFVKDELTVQANNLYSNAVGGVKLQVPSEDAERATELLKELGYLKDEPVETDLLTWVDTKTQSIPVIKDLNVINRIVVLLILVVVIVTAFLYYALNSSSSLH